MFAVSDHLKTAEDSYFKSLKVTETEVVNSPPKTGTIKTQRYECKHVVLSFVQLRGTDSSFLISDKTQRIDLVVCPSKVVIQDSSVHGKEGVLLIL
jgi:hypothetical protein